MALDKITTGIIADNAVSTAKVADDAVTNAKIGSDAVGPTELADDAVTIAKLAASGTASATTFLKGDNTWASPVNYVGGNISGGTVSSYSS